MVSSLLITLLLVNTVFFGILTLRSFLNIIPKKYESIAKVETAIVSINFVQYLTTFIIENSDVLADDAQKFAQQLRVVNSLITSLMVLFTYWKLANLEGYDGKLPIMIILNFILILVNVISEFFHPSKTIYRVLFGIGIACYITLVIFVVNIMKFFSKNGFSNKYRLGYYVLFGLSMFPLTFFLNFETKYIVFCLADFITKGIYAINLGTLIRSPKAEF